MMQCLARGQAAAAAAARSSCWPGKARSTTWKDWCADMPRAVVTGGAGYIGSHTCVTLLEAGWDVVVIDNLANSSAVAVDRVRGLVPGGGLVFREGDLLDADALDECFGHGIDAVVHFAGCKAVGESVAL